jgi:hypothetical protein
MSKITKNPRLVLATPASKDVVVKSVKDIKKSIPLYIRIK